MANQRVLFGGLKVMGALLVTGMLVVACGDDDGDSDGGATGGSTSTGGGAGETGTGGGTDTGGSGTTGGAANTGGASEGGAGGMGGSGTGGNVNASPECATYCTGQTGVVQVCGATLAAENPFDNEGDCLTQCAAQSNWDLDCRQDHLQNVIDDPGDADFHCPHTIGQDGFCADD